MATVVEQEPFPRCFSNGFLMIAKRAPKLVIFDLFGTLIRYKVRHHPFRTLLKWAKSNGRKVRVDDARYLMTKDLDTNDLARSMGIDAPSDLLNQIHLEIEQELGSLELYDDVIPIWNELNALGISIAVCSNLAKPYGRALELLPAHVNYLSCLSYEVGFIKPEPEIYSWILERAGIDRQQCLFVGDTYIADYEGPNRMGMRAFHLVRTQGRKEHEISSLLEILR